MEGSEQWLPLGGGVMGDFDFLLSCFFNPSKFSATDKECDFKNSLSKTISKVEYGIICNIKKRVQFVSQTHNVFGPNGEVSEQLPSRAQVTWHIMWHGDSSHMSIIYFFLMPHSNLGAAGPESIFCIWQLVLWVGRGPVALKQTVALDCAVALGWSLIFFIFVPPRAMRGTWPRRNNRCVRNECVCS